MYRVLNQALLVGGILRSRFIDIDTAFHLLLDTTRGGRAGRCVQTRRRVSLPWYAIRTHARAPRFRHHSIDTCVANPNRCSIFECVLWTCDKEFNENFTGEFFV